MNWIKVRTHLISHPHVVRIASALCLPSVHVFGALVHIWSVADSHADGDLLKNMTPAALDRLTETPGLTSELATVGWIIVREDGMQLVNYQEHNGASAKRRALEAKRKKGFRIASAECPQDVRIESGQDAELEKNRYKKKKKKEKEKNSDSSPVLITFPTDGEVPHWHLRQAKVDRLAELFPKLDILAEARTALAWIEANPEQRKTANGMDRFFTGWLTRSNNKPKQPTTPTYQTRTAPVVRKWSEVFAQQAGLTVPGSGQPLPCLPEVVR